MARQDLRTGVFNSVDDMPPTMAERLNDGLDAVLDEAAVIKNKAMQGASDMADCTSKSIKNAEKEAEIMFDAAKQQASNLQDVMKEEFRTHPLRSLGIAAAIGLVAGYLSRR